MKNRIRVIASVFLAMALSACGTESAGLKAGELGGQNNKGITYSKTIELVDASGHNSAIATLSSSDKNLLAEVDAGSLTLIAIYENGDVDEVEVPDEESAVLPMGDLALELNDEVMAEGVIALEVVESGAPTYRAPFAWRYRYSYDDCVNVTRTSFWHKVYTSIWSKSTPSSSWSTMVSYRKLANNETLERCKSGSYRLKVGVKARQTSHYNIEFWE